MTFSSKLLNNLHLVKEGAWIILGQVFSIAGGLFLIRTLTVKLIPLHFGQLTLGLTIGALITQAITGGLTNGISRLYSVAAEQRDLTNYFASVRRLMRYALYIIIIIGFLLVVIQLVFGFYKWVWLSIMVLILSIVSSYSGAITAIQSAARQRGIVAIHSSLDVWLKIIFCIAAVKIFGSASHSVVFGYLIASVILLCSQYFWLTKLIHNKANITSINAPVDWRPKIWANSWQYSVWGVFTWFQQVSDRWAIETFSTTQAVGMYSVVFQLGYAPIGIIANMAVTLLGPVLFQRAGPGQDHHRNSEVQRVLLQVAFVGLLITGISFAVTFICHNLIFRLFVGEKYHATSHLLPWVILAGGLFATGQILSLKPVSEMNPSALISAKITTALVGCLLNIVGAYYFGVPGVVAGLVGFSVLYISWMGWISVLKH